MVYDLGGGSFDVTVMNISIRISVLATGGDRNWGELILNNKIMGYIRVFLEKNDIDLLMIFNDLQDLRQKAEYCKKMLSNKEKASVSIMCQGKALKVDIDRDMFNEMIVSQLNRTALIMESVLEDAKLHWQDVSKIILVGGSTRVKQVQQLIEDISGIKPSHNNPDEAVALCAAIQGELLMNDGEDAVHNNQKLIL